MTRTASFRMVEHALLMTSGMSCHTTLSRDQGGLRLPPKAARTAGPLEGADAPVNQSREAHLAARPLHSPKGGQSAAVCAADWPPLGHEQR